MNRILNTLLFCAITTIAAAQTTAAPLGTYNEPNYPLPANYETQWAKVQTPVQLSWGSTDIRYNKYDVPAVKQQHKALLKAWRGERVNAQAVLWTKGNLDDVRIEMSALKSDKDVILQSALSTHFVRYVMGDCLNPDGSGCGHRKPADYDSVLVADVLDINASLSVKSKTTQPLWLCINVPRNANPGKYIGTMTVSASNMKAQHLEVNLEVLAHTLPDAQQWHLNLDLWQNPTITCRYGAKSILMPCVQLCECCVMLDNIQLLLALCTSRGMDRLRTTSTRWLHAYDTLTDHGHTIMLCSTVGWSL